jgi:hypothetical protein
MVTYLGLGALYVVHEVVLQMKLSITVEELCKGLPTSFCNFVGHIRSLDFDRKPDYQYLHSILSQVSESETAEVDQPNNALPPAHPHPLPPAHSRPSPPAHSPASPSAHPSFNAQHAPVFSDEK